MRPQLFKIKRSNERPQSPIHTQRQADREDTAPNNQLAQLINVLQAFVNQGVNPNPNPAQPQPQNQQQLQPRDKLPIIHCSTSHPSLITDREMQIWITDVCKTTFSTTFNYYYTDQLSYEQARIFCAETILTNIVKLTQKMKLTPTQIKTLDEYIQNKILPFMIKKYPLTGETDVNKALEQAVEEVNSFDQLQNDFIYITKTKFSYRKSGNYNDLIMSVLNRVLKAIDENSKSHQDPISNYKDFEHTMSTIFQKVEDLSWVTNKTERDEKQQIKKEQQMTQSVLKDQAEKEKYKEKVKAYTNYLIGRKVSENVDLFNEGEIENEHLVVKHPSILRILTKWCEELESKFTNANYMKEHLENIETLGGDINSLNDQHRENLDEKLHTQMISIREYLDRLKATFYYEQSCELLRHLQPDDNNFITPYEKAFGKFSCQTVKNLHTYIIKYLNRLIHGLVKVSYDWHRQSGYKNNFQKWSYPPNLVTFKVGDLIRCKCSSKQREILNIFNELNSISARNPERLKIVRIKNRLRTQTNDILINVKFNNCLIGEIQLAVNTKKSRFAQYSNNFNHYLYELQRCIFGPFSELANIWKNIDLRSQSFDEIIRSEGRAEVGMAEIRRIDSTIPCACSGHKYTVYDLPLRCTFCRNYHSHNDVIISNVQCLACGTFKCMRCQVESMGEEDLKMRILGKRYQQLGKKMELATSEMPSCGFYVETDSRVPRLQYFKQYKINGILYYLGKKNGRIFRVVKSDDKSLQNFFYHNLVFKLKEDTDEFIRMTDAEVKQCYILPEYVEGIYRSEKKVLFLNQKRIDASKWPGILCGQKSSDNRLNIKKLEIENNGLSDISFVTEIFPNLESIDIDGNPSCSLEPVTRLPLLKHICWQYVGVTSIPSSIANLTNLVEFNIYRNSVAVLPPELFQLKNLRILNLKYNLFTELPKAVVNLTNLNELLLRGNNLASIPDCIEELTSLNILNLGKCGMKTLNPKIGKLRALKILDLAVNEFSELPDSFADLVNLEKLKLQENRFEKLPQFLSNFTKLKQLTINSNKVQEITLDFSRMSNLDVLNLSSNRISHIDPSLTCLKELSAFYLHNNQYRGALALFDELVDLEDLSLDTSAEGNCSYVPKEICSLSSLLTLKLKATQPRLILTPSIKQLNQLEQLNLSKNQLIQVPKDIIHLSTLEKIYLDDNQISQFPAEYLNNLNKLEEVNLKGNRLRKVDQELLKLKILNLSSNLITEIDIPIGANTSLTKLRLRENQLTSVPKNISQLKKLKELDLSYNKIVELQQGLIQLRNMEYLSFHIYGNPIKHIRCGNFIQSQMCEASKIFINSLVTELTALDL